MADEGQPLSLDEVVNDLIIGKPEAPPKPNGKAEAAGDTTAPEGAGDEENGPPDPTPEGDAEEGPAPDDGDVEDDDDDPLYEVKVSGKVQEVRLSELLANWSGEKAIAARLQEATEARNAAQNARNLALEQEREAAREIINADRTQLRQQIDNLSAVYQHYGNAILTPRVQPPDPSLKATDPIGYWTQMDDYRQEESRLAKLRQHMQETVDQQSELERESRETFANEQAQAILREVPAMADEKYRRAQVQRVHEVGRSVGFSDDEIRMYTADRRTIYLAMLAAEGFEAIVKRHQAGDVTARAKIPSAVPPPSVRARTVATLSAKRKAARSRARETGSVEDVAQTLIVPAPRNKGRRPQA
jgi:hypothetical protein